MQVHVYRAVSADTPDGVSHVARIWCEFTGKKNKAVMDWSPVIFTAATADGARDRAETWWTAEVEKARAKVENAKRAGERLAKARAVGAPQ